MLLRSGGRSLPKSKSGEEGDSADADADVGANVGGKVHITEEGDSYIWVKDGMRRSNWKDSLVEGALQRLERLGHLCVTFFFDKIYCTRLISVP